MKANRIIKKEIEMNTSLRTAIERMIEKLPTWREDAILYQYDDDGTYDCDPRSTYDTVSREHETTKIFECHDLNEIFPHFGQQPADIDWLEEVILINYG
jgi:hypothetical protein